MSMAQYHAYFETIGIIPSLKTTNSGKVREIGGTQHACQIENIQIPFKDLTLVRDIPFLVLIGSIPTLL